MRKIRVKWYGDEIITPNLHKAFVPEWWSKWTLAILLKNLVMGNMISRDFQDEIAQAGDVINTRVPIPVKVRRREGDEDIVTDKIDAKNIQVRLNQQTYASFEIPDKLQTIAMQDILSTYLVPQVQKFVERIEQIILAQVPRFYMEAAGRPGELGGPTARTTMLDARRVMNNNSVDVSGRNFIWNPNSETKVLDTDIFTSAEKVGDNGTALRTASLGEKLGFYHYMSQLLPYGNPFENTPSGMTIAVGASAGANRIEFSNIDGAAGARVGAWVRFAGDEIPHRILGISGTTVTFEPALNYQVMDGAVIYGMGDVIPTAAGITLGQGYIEVADAYLDLFPINRSFTLGAEGEPFTVIDYDPVNKRLETDRPIEAIYPVGTEINLFPNVDMNFAFNKYAITLVSRPLLPPYGVSPELASVINYGGFSIRCVQSYDPRKQKSTITIDSLMGIQVLDTKRGCLVYG